MDFCLNFTKLLVIVMATLNVAPAVTYAADDQRARLNDALAELNSRDFNMKATAIARIAELPHERTSVVLDALLAGHLSSLKSDKRTVGTAAVEGCC